MTSTELKAEVYQLIDRLDEPFLKVVHSMLDTYMQQQEDPIVGYIKLYLLLIKRGWKY